MIAGTRPVPASTRNTILCDRCGMERVPNGKRRPLCADCRWVLSDEERLVWL